MVHTRARLKAASEDGFGLIEVLVSSMVLIIVVLGTLAAIDAVSSTAGSNQARTIAASLAEKDQERMRALRTTEVDKIVGLANQTETVNVGNVPYTIKSEARWVSEGSEGDISCTSASVQGSYLRITSTVTSPVTGAAVKPVVLSSIVAPQPGKGTLVGKVINAAGLPVRNMAVQATGPTPGNELTNDAGCAIFPQREAGSYLVKLNSGGWIDPSSNPMPEKSATVSAGNVTTVELIYDEKSSFSVRVVTVVGGVQRDDRSNGVIAAHSGLSTAYRFVNTASDTTYATVFAFSDVFPFPTPYQLYSGRCTGNNPATPIPTYFATHPLAVAQASPGVPVPERQVIEPAINVAFKFGSPPSGGTPGAKIYAYPKTAGCDTPKRIHMGDTNATGKLDFPGLPFGSYDLCAQYTSGSSTYRAVRTALSNTNPAGTAWAVNMTTSTTKNTCKSNTPTT